MKPLFKVSLLTATILLAVGCQKEEQPQAGMSSQADSAQAEIHFKTDEDKAAYSIGVSFARYLESNLDQSKEVGINLGKDFVIQGIQHAFAGTEKLTEEEVKVALETLDKNMAELMQAQAAQKAEEALKLGNEFRAEFEKQDGVKKTESGLLYQVITPAEGQQPAETDTVEVHYVGTLINGTKFDSSYDRSQTATFPLNRVIPGWTEGVQLMSVGSKFKLVIPPELAYGEQETPAIPANSTLIFEVELVSINNTEASEQ